MPRRRGRVELRKPSGRLCAGAHTHCSCATGHGVSFADTNQWPSVDRFPVLLSRKSIPNPGCNSVSAYWLATLKPQAAPDRPFAPRPSRAKCPRRTPAVSDSSGSARQSSSPATQTASQSRTDHQTWLNNLQSSGTKWSLDPRSTQPIVLCASAIHRYSASRPRAWTSKGNRGLPLQSVRWSPQSLSAFSYRQFAWDTY